MIVVADWKRAVSRLPELAAFLAGGRFADEYRRVARHIEDVLDAFSTPGGTFGATSSAGPLEIADVCDAISSDSVVVLPTGDGIPKP